MRHKKLQDWRHANNLDMINFFTRRIISEVLINLRAFDREQHTARHYALAEDYLARYKISLHPQACENELAAVDSLMKLCKEFFQDQLNKDKNRAQVNLKIEAMEKDIISYEEQIKSLERSIRYGHRAIQNHKDAIEKLKHRVNEAIDFLDKAELPNL